MSAKRPKHMTTAELEALPIATEEGGEVDGFRIPAFDLVPDLQADDVAAFRDARGVVWNVNRYGGVWKKRQVRC